MLGWLIAACAVLLLLLSFLWPGSGDQGSGHAPEFPRRTAGVSTPCGATLICKPSALANYLRKHCGTFLLPCGGSGGWGGGRVLAQLRSLFEVCWPYDSPVRFVRDNLQLSDDGLVALDWAVPSYQRRRRSSGHSSSPVLIIVPNSFGRITRNVLQLCEAALSHGYLPVVFNRRGQNGTPLSTAKLQQFGDPADLREAVRYIRYRHPAGRLYAVSESSGSGLLLSYLGECGSSSYVTAAACLSPIFRCQSWFESGLHWPQQWALARYQKTGLRRYRTALSGSVRTEALFSSCSLRGVEEALFCQAGQSATWDAYWERNEPLRDVDEVAIPVLSVCARDDPVRGDPQSTIPLELFETNPHFFLLLTERGGHLGFHARPEARALDSNGSACGAAVNSQGPNWSHSALLEFFRATTDFFSAEERAKQHAARRQGLGARAFRHRSISTCKRVPACSHNIHAIYNWQRSYTR